MTVIRMKIKTAIICLMCFYLCGNSTQMSVYADEAAKPGWMPGINAGAAFETKYIWRGQLMVDDVVMQPGASVMFDSITVSFWGNYDLGSLDKFTEWDYIFDYTLNVGDIMEQFGAGGKYGFIEPVSLSFGYIYYTFPPLTGDAYDSQEFYTRFAYDVFTQPFVTYYDDFDTGGGSYWEFGVSHTFELCQYAEAVLGVAGAYNAGQWGYGYKFAPVLFSGKVNIKVFDYFTITPDVNYSMAVDRSRKDNGSAYSSEFYGGVKAGVEF